MRKKLIERTEPPRYRKKGWRTIVQETEGIIILNIFCDGILKARHCVDIGLKDYATWHPGGKWSRSKIEWSYDIETEWQYGYYNRTQAKLFKASPEDRALLLDRFPNPGCLRDENSPFTVISMNEYDWERERRESVEKRRVARVEETMSRIPLLPDDIKEWFYRTAVGEDYALKQEDGEWCCTACFKSAPRKSYMGSDGGTVRNNDITVCPNCGSRIKFRTWSKGIFECSDFVVAQPVDENMSVIKFCEGQVIIEPKEGRKNIWVGEKIRVLSGRGNFSVGEKNMYYRQWRHGNFDNKSNPANCRIFGSQYMYPLEVREALSGTKMEMWASLFEEWAAAGLKLAYDKLMTCFDKDVHGLMEMLYRGRFYKLLSRESGQLSYTGTYYGMLNIKGTTIEDTFRIENRQLINRLRDRDGGGLMLSWLQWSERNHTKLSDKVLAWLKKNELYPENMAWTKLRFTPEQAMNYIERQKREQYKGMKVRGVINQYEDYMDMCRKLKKDVADEMVYRPRELKRRHDEAAAEIALRESEIRAEEYSRRYPDAEKVLGEIAEKLEYRNDRYVIIVPKRNAEIVAEGKALHHCAGATDRYFDRIAQRETYICFLRKVQEPEIPYYTIEVEPGGTIRQHRGMYDEEPEFDEVKPFLHEWQKEIRRRMNEQDHELASVSAVKREENIRELQEKNNTRVLEGLMQDFMEAAG